MIGITTSEIYTSIFITTEENNKFEQNIFTFSEKGRITYRKVRDEIEKDLEFPDITATDLQDEIIGPIIFKDYRKKLSKRMKSGTFMDI